jgi:hypothetical protein
MGIILLGQLGQQPSTEVFVRAVQTSLYHQVVVFTLVFLLTLRLPPTPG